ncbi:aldehyde dehydrogenase [Pseudarthrobacter sp. B4EP4b]|uniref:aldehyde dehydrogenase n=1 Tax=Pseudarthrobacter sp. B4EP4b TaxID=2590664 RepID=UPI001152BA70|nr:aldehyde dehydrogenase [Pseudarthrobacter sp. B4EP4b]
MIQGLVTSAAPIARPECLFIDGKWVEPATGGRIDVINPATEQVYVSVAEATEPDIDRAVAAARAAFDHGPWPRLSHAERAEYLRSMGEKLNERVDDVAQIWPSEMGTTHAVAHAFAGTIGGAYEYYADLADTFPFEERFDNPPGGGKLALIVREPVGVVGAIIPWNAPMNIMAYKIAPALLAGCTVVLKNSPEAPGAGYVMAEIAEAIGLPPGVLNVVTADRGPSERLVRHPDVDKISFTGSLGAGKRIAGLAAERIARVTLELGGKSAAVVLDDYDIDAAAQSIAGYACFLTGQVCSSLSRVIVSRSRHDELVEALSSVFGGVKVGDPFDPATGMGPIATRSQLEKVEHYARLGVSEGATLAHGGRRPAHLSRGWFFEPTVLANVDNNATVAREEIFGPVLSVIPADNEEHAIELANDSIFGLNNSVFTNDVDRAYAVARQLRSGTVGHNVFRSDMRIGFGGFKQSGLGREGGVDGLRPFLENKTVILDEIPSHLK